MTEIQVQPLAQRRLLLIISGGIAAYKSLDLIRELQRAGARVRCVLTKGAQHFVTPLSVSALSGDKVYDDLWSLTDEAEMGHIRLAREADAIIVAPATANIMAQVAQGLAQDLATTILLATDRPILMAPAMNPVMWANAATQNNVATLKTRGITLIGPDAGVMACGETGDGRMSTVPDIVSAITERLTAHLPLRGIRALVTSGPTHEPIDDVRYLGNHASGKQGHAIAQALAFAGAHVTLVTGPVALPDPHGVHTVHVQTALHMFEAVKAHLPMDVAICAAAVADWRVEQRKDGKFKKQAGGTPPTLALVENPDILSMLGHLDAKARPKIVVGFAAEVENLVDTAAKKCAAKRADFILANNVAGGAIFGADTTHVMAVNAHGLIADWGPMTKDACARMLTETLTKDLRP